jgi:hypothetical protein
MFVVNTAKKLITTLQGLALTTLILLVAPSTAFGLSLQEGVDAARGTDQAVSLFGSAGVFTTLTNTLLFIVGAISVIMVIAGGLRYVVSGGNATNISTAKNTILYAVIGLVISILAYAVINFVITSFMPGGSDLGTNV